MTLNVNFPFRVSRQWLTLLDSLMGRRGVSERSAMVRATVEREALLWAESPYYSSRSRHFILVRANGDVYYRRLDYLHLNSHRARLPASISMKPEKQIELESRYQNEPRQIDLLRQQWIFCRFNIWEGDELEGKPWRSETDELGIFRKFADIEINKPAPSHLVREILVGLRDYVQRQPAEAANLASDRAGVAIEFPIMNFEAEVMVERRLYPRDSNLWHAAQVGREFRNLEEARFQDAHLETTGNQILWQSGQFPRDEGLKGPRATIAVVTASYRELLVRLRAQGAALPGATGTPGEFLFGRLQWPTPQIGLEVCLTWNKPPSRDEE